MSFFIRDIDPENHSEIDQSVRWAMETVLETCPEFEGKEELALKAFSNFTFDQMKKMFTGAYENPDHRTLLAFDENTNEPLGHSIFSIKMDDNQKKYGFCYSRYVAPKGRKRGIASSFLEIQEKWWKDNQAEYIFAQTHVTNLKLQSLFLKHGFEKFGPKQGKHYDFYELRKDLV